jgi:lipopolysaccharide assembly outer membrane protein LptD (OstA)
MKYLASLGLIAFCSLAAQDSKTAGSEPWLPITMGIGSTLPNAGFSTAVPIPAGVSINFGALQMRREGSFLLMKGDAEISTDLVTIYAVEAKYNWDTGEVATRGNRAFRSNRSIEPKN